MLASDRRPDVGDDPPTPVAGALGQGTQLSHYEILAPLGAGGMGEVYRARDTTLDRHVAIKVLPEDFADDPARLARFEREAKLLASLNHPNVATIHGFDESNGVHFIAMELVEGQSLAEQIRTSRGLPVDVALQIARRIAMALEAAHEAGVIHRDLKPANVHVTPDGHVKVLDFGLAKVTEPEGALDLSKSPTLMAPTATGVVLGTAHYMSPEQARGKPLDKRTDIWSFGCVLYEMLTGKTAFSGATVMDVLSAILEHEPDWEAIPGATPLTVRYLLRRCLQKDPERRVRDIRDARIEIEEGPSISNELVPGAVVLSAPASTWRWMLPWAVATIAVATLVVRPLLPSTTDAGVTAPTHLVLALEPGLRLSGRHRAEHEANLGGLRPSRTAMTISPGGQDVVYCATRGEDNYQLYRRRLSAPSAVPIPGTEGGCNPFFSPDGQSVGYFLRSGPSEFDLKIVSVEGGQPRTLVGGASSNYTTGAAWGSEGTIVFSDSSGLYRILATGGSKEQLTQPDTENGERAHRFPQLLPGEENLLFSIRKGWDWDEDWDATEIVVQSLESGDRKTLITGGMDARYVSTGHLVFVREATLMAVRFDLRHLEIIGEPIRVLEDVMQDWGFGIGGMSSGAGQFAVSESGTLVFAPGGTAVALRGYLAMFDLDQGGNFGDLHVRDAAFGRVSPDGTQLAYADAYSDGRPGSNEQGNLRIYDIERSTARVLASPSFDVDPIWSPDGMRIAYSSGQDQNSVLNLYVRMADGTGEPERLTTNDQSQAASSWSINGDLAFGTVSLRYLDSTYGRGGRAPAATVRGAGVVSELLA